jgi:acyl-coenzyme A thioesterase PaaI-like protein
MLLVGIDPRLAITLEGAPLGRPNRPLPGKSLVPRGDPVGACHAAGNHEESIPMINPAPSDQVKTYLPTYAGCFVCGQGHPTGLGVRYYVGAGECVHAGFRPSQNQTSYANVVHGGIISTFLDELLGWPICLANELICYTGEISVRFRKPAFVGQAYLGTAFPGTKHAGKPYWDARGVLTDESGTVLVEATGRYFVASQSQTRAFSDLMTYQPGDLPVFREPLGRRELSDI